MARSIAIWLALVLLLVGFCVGVRSSAPVSGADSDRISVEPEIRRELDWLDDMITRSSRGELDVGLGDRWRLLLVAWSCPDGYKFAVDCLLVDMACTDWMARLAVAGRMWERVSCNQCDGDAGIGEYLAVNPWTLRDPVLCIVGSAFVALGLPHRLAVHNLGRLICLGWGAPLVPALMVTHVWIAKVVMLGFG